MKNNTIIQVILVLLILNNLIGIVLNLELTIISICFLLGIPGVLAFLANAYWFYKVKKSEFLRTNLIFYSFFLIFYNVLIFWITFEDNLMGFALFYSFIFPLINICLYTMLMIASFYYVFNLKNKLK